MSLQPIEAKRRRSELTTGTYLVVIHDLSVFKDATGNPSKIDGHLAIIVTFYSVIEDKHKYYDHLYILDNDYRQEYFNKLLANIKIEIPKGSSVKKSEVIGKKLYICISEIHHVNDDKIVTDDSSNPIIEYQMFKGLPFYEWMPIPKVKGDPWMNNGLATDDFVKYKNIAKSLKTPTIEIDYNSVPPFQKY